MICDFGTIGIHAGLTSWGLDDLYIVQRGYDIASCSNIYRIGVMDHETCSSHFQRALFDIMFICKYPESERDDHPINRSHSASPRDNYHY